MMPGTCCAYRQVVMPSGYVPTTAEEKVPSLLGSQRSDVWVSYD